MYSFISPEGQRVKTKTVKEFALKYGFTHSMARSLACGYRARLRGWCSTAKRAKKHRDRFTTVLVNTRTGERSILGSSIKSFAEKRNLCMNELWKLVNGRKLIYRHWCLQKTLDSANGTLADGDL